MPAQAPDVDEVVEQLINEHGGAIIRAGLNGDISQASLDAAQDLAGAARDALQAGRQLEADLADLNRRRDLLPLDGYQRLVRDAKNDAQEKARAAQHAADRAYTRLEDSLFEDALPKLTAAREQLARDEAHLALSHGSPEAATLHLAANGNDEPLAALFTSWGRTLLEARGVRDVDRTLADARKIARGRVMERADTTAAVLLRDNFHGLGAAKGSAGSKVRDLAR